MAIDLLRSYVTRICECAQIMAALGTSAVHHIILTLLLFNFARAQHLEVMKATVQAHFPVPVVWVDCYEECQKPAGPYAVIAIESSLSSIEGGILGFSTTNRDGQRLAYVLVGEPRLMAYSALHELGHLCGLPHAMTGMMAEGVRPDLIADGNPYIGFTREEADQIRNNLLVLSAGDAHTPRKPALMPRRLPEFKKPL